LDQGQGPLQLLEAYLTYLNEYFQAGSGKSTLMKFASKHRRSHEALQQWAHGEKVRTPSYYFWSAGSDMQKSQIGLLQSLLYQIFKEDPELIPLVCPDRQHHEKWSIQELKAVFENISKQKSLPAKYCFFIDGLDEYDGNDEDMCEILKFLLTSCHIKICASSRSRHIFEEFFTDGDRLLVVENYTREDMKTYARETLDKNPKFQALKATEPDAQDMITYIADHAGGVWLWTHLVISHLIREVNRNESLSSLQKILRELPDELEDFYLRIVEGCNRRHRTEMAIIFLVTLRASRSLPAYAYSIIEKEKSQPGYALRCDIGLYNDNELAQQKSLWKVRIQNRCGDLLVVHEAPPKPGPQLVGKDNKVEFLHRSVRDFLVDKYFLGLQEEAGSEFTLPQNVLKLLMNMQLFVAKSNVTEARSQNTVHMVNYADDALRPKGLEKMCVFAMLDEMLRVEEHWEGQYPQSDWVDVHLLEEAVRRKLLEYVRGKLNSKPYRTNTLLKNSMLRVALSEVYRVGRVELKGFTIYIEGDINMVELLLECGAEFFPEDTDWKPWSEYMRLMSFYFEHERPSGPEKGAQKIFYQVCQLCFQHAPKRSSISDNQFPNRSEVRGMYESREKLEDAFGKERTDALFKIIEDAEAENSAQGSDQSLSVQPLELPQQPQSWISRIAGLFWSE
jgi:hypothetical protein